MRNFNNIDKFDEYSILGIHLPKPITDELYNELYSKGILRKEELKINSYYLGQCRNADVAMWTGVDFIYMRYKFKSYYVDKINHLSDDDGYDLFIPLKEVEPRETQIIKR